MGCEAKKDNSLTTPPTPTPPTPEYTITFDTNGGNTIALVKVKQGDKLTKPVEPIKAGHLFKDWYTEKDLKTLFNFTTQTITADTTIYAKWERQEYSVTFDTDNGSSVDLLKILYEGKVTRPTDPTKSEYFFVNWYKDEAKKEVFNFDTEKIIEDITLYAKWGKISFSYTTVASSIELEFENSIELNNIGAVIRLASESAPTKEEAMVSKGYINLNIPAADVAQKISISQHYGSIFSDGLTLDDVLAPNTAYKLYLYFPTGNIPTTATTGIKGLSITNNRAVIPFTTAMLPAEGDAQWLNNNGTKCVASLDTLYFMQEQTGIVMCYFYVNHDPLAVEVLNKDKDGSGMFVFNNIGTYDGTSGQASAAFNFEYGLISGYTSNSTNSYIYFIGTDKTGKLQNAIRTTIINPNGLQTTFDIPVTRY